MKRPLHFSKKVRQLKFFAKKISRLLDSGGFQQLDVQQQLLMVRKLNTRYDRLKSIMPERKLRRWMTSAIVFIGLGSAVQAQDFGNAQFNPFGLTNTNVYAFPEAVDIDADGDYDVFAAEYYGALKFFENTGSATEPAFAAAETNPMGLVSPGIFSFMSFADLDADGDFDLLAGSYVEDQGAVHSYFENIGTASEPAFAAPSVNPFGLSALDYFSAPCVVDVDADGDLDVLSTSYYGVLNFFENTGTASEPAFAPKVENPFGYVSPLLTEEDGDLGLPDFADYDDDGDLDLMFGAYQGKLYYFENIGSAEEMVFDDVAEDPFNLEVKGTYITAVEAVDLDGDGDLDLILGNAYEDESGRFLYYENLDNAGPVNTPPTIDVVEAQTVCSADSPWTVELTGISAGAEGEDQELIIATSDSGIVDEVSVDYEPGSDSATLVITENDLELGTSEITVTVNDGQSENATTNMTFSLTIENCTSVQDATLSQKLTLFPNPVIDRLSIEVHSLEETVGYELLDILGSSIAKGELKRQGEAYAGIVEMQEYDSGIYFLKVFTDEDSHTSRIVKK